jgi:uncharacterized protein
MGKTLFWIAVFFGVLLVSRFLSHQAAKKRFRGEQGRPSAKPSPLPASEAMVRCTHCDVFLPRSEALLIQGETWCSEAHAKLGPRRSH